MGVAVGDQPLNSPHSDTPLASGLWIANLTLKPTGQEAAAMALAWRVLALARWPQLEPFVALAIEIASALLWTGRGLATAPPMASEASRALLPVGVQVCFVCPTRVPPKQCGKPAVARHGRQVLSVLSARGLYESEARHSLMSARILLVAAKSWRC